MVRGPSRFCKLAKFKSFMFSFFFHKIILFDVMKAIFFPKSEMKLSKIDETYLCGDLLLHILLKTAYSSLLVRIHPIEIGICQFCFLTRNHTTISFEKTTSVNHEKGFQFSIKHYCSIWNWISFQWYLHNISSLKNINQT